MNNKYRCSVKDVKVIPGEEICGISRDYLGIPFSAGGFRAEAQKDVMWNFEE